MGNNIDIEYDDGREKSEDLKLVTLLHAFHHLL